MLWFPVPPIPPALPRVDSCSPKAFRSRRFSQHARLDRSAAGELLLQVVGAYSSAISRTWP
jgi:hypothetical protein